MVIGLWSSVAVAYRLPKHSWETLPVAWHSALDHMPTSAEISTLARFSLVTLEKSQGEATGTRARALSLSLSLFDISFPSIRF